MATPGMNSYPSRFVYPGQWNKMRGYAGKIAALNLGDTAKFVKISKIYLSHDSKNWGKRNDKAQFAPAILLTGLYKYAQLEPAFGMSNGQYMNRLYANIIFYGIERGFKFLVDKYPAKILINQIEVLAQQIKGPDQILVIEKLNKLSSKIKSIDGKIPTPKTTNLKYLYDRYDGTSWYFSQKASFDSFGPLISSWTALLSSYKKSSIDLASLRDNAQFIIETQKAEREELEKQANAFYNQILALLEMTTGSEKLLYTNEVSKLVQLDLAPRIAAFKVTIGSMEATIAQQKQALEIKSLNEAIEQATSFTMQLMPVLQSLPVDLQKPLLVELDNANSMPDGEEKAVILGVLKTRVILAAAKNNFEILTVQLNTLAGKLPQITGQEIFNELLKINENIDPGQLVSVESAAANLNILIVKSEIVLAELNAAQIETTLEETEAVRMAEIAALAIALEQKKTAQIIEFKEQVNLLLPGLPPSLQSLFFELEAEAGEMSLDARLARYAALVPQMHGAQAIAEKYADLTPSQITGLELEIRENVILGSLLNESDILTTDANSIKFDDEQAKPKGAAALILPLGLLTLLSAA